MIHDGLPLEKCETTELLPKNKILRPSFCDLVGIKLKSRKTTKLSKDVALET